MKLSILLSIITMMTFFGAYPSPKAVEEKISFGAYDPSGSYSNLTKISYESVFFGWNVNMKSYRKSIDTISEKGRIPLITVEPWQHPNDKQYLANTLKGAYDREIKTICNPLQNLPDGTIFRFAHEMELSGRYPWSQADPKSYVAVYQYFVDKCRALIKTKTNFMWSPSGEAGLEHYWPGENYVDFVGISIYMNKSWDQTNIGHSRSFSEILDSKYKRVFSYNKPIIIAESAVTGSSEIQEQWITEGIKSLHKYPLVTGYVYFNAKDIDGVWGANYETPNWSLASDSFERIIEKYSR